MSRPVAFHAGEKYKTNEGYNVIVLVYKDHSSILVTFEGFEHYEFNVNGSALRHGKIKNPYHRSVCGVGFLGVGKHKASRARKDTIEYYVWLGMLRRCYDEATQSRQPTYIGCTVHPDWHNFQNFAEWYTKNTYYNIKGFELDKDIKLRGNKEYSEHSCLLVPKKINTLFSSNTGVKADNLPRGVTKHGNRYRVTNRENKVVSFGSVTEAENFYLQSRSVYIRLLLEGEFNFLDETTKAYIKQNL